MESLLISIKQTAILCGVSPATIWRYAKSHPDFPRAIKISPRVTRWRRADIEAFVQKIGGEA
jgi:prophage regulatory protein